ncbi:MAG: hypothetical protein AWU57_4084 [Marinobacter sp. T13-3]|nr:MAG: hypothetical protein AWU57_4084 [Marinobacter sp. T13-3]
MKPTSLLGPILALTLATSATAAQDTVTLGDFSRHETLPQEPWQLVPFDGLPPTEYQRVTQAGVAAVKATSEASMALLARPLEADLAQTPVLCWRWWVDKPVPQADMSKKSGDDYAARVYMTFDLPSSAMSLGTRMKLSVGRTLFGEQLPDAAINYVWDNKHPVGTTMPNAYTDRAQMVVLRSGTADTGQWVEERRNLLKDLQRFFETAPDRPLQLAIASDSDDTGSSASALFADLHLVAEGEQCQFPSPENSQNTESAGSGS